jgi:23S rRNA pseudouridine1911/1915/1917 synthase
MMSRRLRYRASAEDAGRRLDQFLAAHTPGLSRGAIRKLIDDGAAYVGKRRLKRASYLVREGDVVELYAPQGERSAPPDVDLRILYEDEDLIVVDKPVGVAVQARREGDVGTLEWAVRRHRRTASRGRPYVAVVHRLDQPASGLVVLALRPGAAAKLSRAFAEHAPRRRYLAVVDGTPPSDALEVTLPIGAAGRKMRVDPVHGRPARTHVRVLGRGNDRALVEAELATGRTHQIRVHLAAIGHPIAGDRLYGGSSQSRLALHAAALHFTHPRTGEHLELESPLPAELSAMMDREE